VSRDERERRGRGVALGQVEGDQGRRIAVEVVRLACLEVGPGVALVDLGLIGRGRWEVS
jgi:hypothetical protein